MNKNLVLRPISVVMVSDGIPDVKKEGKTDFGSLIVAPLEKGVVVGERIYRVFGKDPAQRGANFFDRFILKSLNRIKSLGLVRAGTSDRAQELSIHPPGAHSKVHIVFDPGKEMRLLLKWGIRQKYFGILP